MEFVAKAKTSGLSSLSELHKVEEHDNFAYQREPKPVLETITSVFLFS